MSGPAAAAKVDDKTDASPLPTVDIHRAVQGHSRAAATAPENKRKRGRPRKNGTESLKKARAGAGAECGSASKGASAGQGDPEPGPSRLLVHNGCCEPGALCDAHSDAVANDIAQPVPQSTRPHRIGHRLARARRLSALAKKAKPNRFRLQKQPLSPTDSEEEAAKPSKKSYNSRPQPLVLNEGDTTRRYRCASGRCKALVEGGDGALLQHWRDKHLAAGATLDPSKISAHELNNELAQHVLDLPRKAVKQAYRVPEGFRCAVCSKVLGHVSRLLSHVPHHLDHPQENYVCSLCPQRVAYFEQSMLLYHYRTQHRNEDPYRCDLCNKGFKYLNLLKVHMKQNHSDNDS